MLILPLRCTVMLKKYEQIHQSSSWSAYFYQICIFYAFICTYIVPYIPNLKEVTISFSSHQAIYAYGNKLLVHWIQQNSTKFGTQVVLLKLYISIKFGTIPRKIWPIADLLSCLLEKLLLLFFVYIRSLDWALCSL